MTELINDEAVYRTAPATPGLLKKCANLIQECIYDKTLYVWSNEFTPAKKVYTTAGCDG